MINRILVDDVCSHRPTSAPPFHTPDMLQISPESHQLAASSFATQLLVGAKQSQKKKRRRGEREVKFSEVAGEIKLRLKALGSFINLHWKLNKEFKGLMNS